MKRSAILACAAIFIIAVTSAAFADSGGRLYGKLTTVGGDVYTGLIRWDKNEASWSDILNGNKDIHRRRQTGHRHERVRVFGITIGERWNWESDDNVQSGICFGHIKTIEPLHGDAVRLTLKSGERIRLEGGSTDIGDESRGIVIEDSKEGEIEIEWGDVDRVEFAR